MDRFKCVNFQIIDKKDTDKSKLNSMIFNYYYDGNLDKNNGYKVYISLEKSNSLVNIIVSPIGRINPRTKAREIYQTIVKLMQFLNIYNKKIRIYLDLLEIIGLNRTHFYRWDFEVNNEKIEDKLVEINRQEFNNLFYETLENYYKQTWNAFTNSNLNNKMKAELAGYALAENCYDEFTAEKITRYFKKYLKHSMKRKETLKNKLTDICKVE